MSRASPEGVREGGTGAACGHACVFYARLDLREKKFYSSVLKAGDLQFLLHTGNPLAPKTYVAHHMQRLSAAAVKGDAKGVRKRANQLKRQVMCAASAAAVDERA